MTTEQPTQRKKDFNELNDAETDELLRLLEKGIDSHRTVVFTHLAAHVVDEVFFPIKNASLQLCFESEIWDLINTMTREVAHALDTSRSARNFCNVSSSIQSPIKYRVEDKLVFVELKEEQKAFFLSKLLSNLYAIQESWSCVTDDFLLLVEAVSKRPARDYKLKASAVFDRLVNEIEYYAKALQNAVDWIRDAYELPSR